MIRLFALWPVLGADAIEIFTVSEKKLDFLQASTFCNSKNAKLLSPKLLPDVRSENNIIVITFHKKYALIYNNGYLPKVVNYPRS